MLVDTKLATDSEQDNLKCMVETFCRLTTFQSGDIFSVKISMYILLDFDSVPLWNLSSNWMSQTRSLPNSSVFDPPPQGDTTTEKRKRATRIRTLTNREKWKSKVMGTNAVRSALLMDVETGFEKGRIQAEFRRRSLRPSSGPSK